MRKIKRPFEVYGTLLNEGIIVDITHTHSHNPKISLVGAGGNQHELCEIDRAGLTDTLQHTQILLSY